MHTEAHPHAETSKRVAPAAQRPTQAAAYLGIARGTLWKLVKGDPDFPQPFKPAPGITLFLTCGLDAWLAAKAEKSAASRSEQLKRVRAYQAKHDGEFDASKKKQPA
ncbi:hypothetical protein AWB68_05578 [Caballeronia choica]|uniref:AlpA family phage regulatory protein n=1 Tax=Caballeronia choica TaxID=326476 RepID=A0A158KDN0_9BURK|nr:hypothetical protein [Caballeronia choica]SAL79155.1 hypothetical protein AWB68_05578 [Caballeronia choica]